ncbi:hypothetical protein C8K30_102306 [Promicromonospora sp. AC04]|uniref:hypothetical protein n=1 Tax=Promicromonospora sp. AC04 TaxID=2135723 RepID=UPI000D3B2C5F|nr:hypothetical protein [Promicromonospora sp. AC04]PUB29928.1 hypothetical protein C8K30_102306 [Promicromonospora sp. AC04]
MKHARTGGPDIAFRVGRRVVSAVADDMSTMQRVGAGVVAALVAVSPFGAWNKVEAQADPIVAGTAIEVGPFDVTVLRAVMADELGYLAPAPGNHMLAVVADVVNTSDVPELSATLGSAVPAPEGVGIVAADPFAGLDTDLGTDPGTGTEPGADGGAATSTDPAAEPSADPSAGSDEAEEPELPSANILNVKDATSTGVLNPGVTYQIALIWEQSGEWEGDEIPLKMLELSWIEESRLTLDNGYWLPADVAFEGPIRVKDNRGMSTEEDQA